jgi:hypothetical protein
MGVGDISVHLITKSISSNPLVLYREFKDNLLENELNKSTKERVTARCSSHNPILVQNWNLESFT